VKTGRPLKYKTNAELEKAIDAYFKDCEGTALKDNDGNAVCDKYGQPVIINRRPPTVTGLALALGFNSRQTLLNYQGRKQFMDTITRAKSKCEEYAESRLYDKDGVNGAKFSLTNNFKNWSEHPVEDDKSTLEYLDDVVKALNTKMENNDET